MRLITSNIKIINKNAPLMLLSFQTHGAMLAVIYYGVIRTIYDAETNKITSLITW